MTKETLRINNTHTPPTTTPTTTPLGTPCLVLDSSGGFVESFSTRPIAELNTSIAASWPNGSNEGTTGPVQLGEYQSVFGYLALLSKELYYNGLCLSNNTRCSEICKDTWTVINCPTSVFVAISESLELLDQYSNNARISHPDYRLYQLHVAFIRLIIPLSYGDSSWDTAGKRSLSEAF